MHIINHIQIMHIIFSDLNLLRSTFDLFCSISTSTKPGPRRRTHDAERNFGIFGPRCGPRHIVAGHAMIQFTVAFLVSSQNIK